MLIYLSEIPAFSHAFEWQLLSALICYWTTRLNHIAIEVKSIELASLELSHCLSHNNRILHRRTSILFKNLKLPTMASLHSFPLVFLNFTGFR